MHVMRYQRFSPIFYPDQQVKVTNYNGTPIANKKVYLREKNQQAKNISLILTTDGNGLANFSVASPKPPTTSITLTVW